MTVINFSNAFINPIVYALRIPEFRQALCLCCSRRQEAMPHSVERFDRTNNKTPTTELRTSQTDSSHLNLGFEQEVMDTKL